MSPAITGAVIIALIAFVNSLLGGSVLYPPAQFTLIWSALVGASAVWSSAYFPLSVETVALFCTGAVAFSAGGALRLVVQQGAPASSRAAAPRTQSRAISWFLAGGLVVLLALLPLFWDHVLSLADRKYPNLWWGIRAGMIALSDTPGQKSWEAFFYDNITVFSILLALTAMANYGERGASKAVALGLVSAATVYNLATASRAGASVVLLGSLGIVIIKQGRLFARHVLAGILGVVIMFVPLTLLRMRTGDLVNDLRIVGDTALLYTVGPLTAFDEYLRNPAALPQTWSVSYFFLHAANRMGFDVSAPSIHVGYVNVGPHALMNVYTMYLAYFSEFGWVGVVVLTALVGYVMVWIYQAAAERHGYMLVLYGIGFAQICQSGFSDGFFMGLNMWMKAALWCLVLDGTQFWRKQTDTVMSRMEQPTAACCE